jgi:hypothetical protein
MIFLLSPREAPELPAPTPSESEWFR